MLGQRTAAKLLTRDEARRIAGQRRQAAGPTRQALNQLGLYDGSRPSQSPYRTLVRGPS